MVIIENMGIEKAPLEFSHKKERFNYFENLENHKTEILEMISQTGGHHQL